MIPYVPSTEQLVTEILVRDIKRSLEFYTKVGFSVLRQEEDFAELAWEEHRLFLAAPSAFHDAPADSQIPSAAPEFPLANLRVMVPNVDDYWSLAQKLGARIIIPIGDRYYGLRDFTIADPDGFGVRFAGNLPTGE